MLRQSDTGLFSMIPRGMTRDAVDYSKVHGLFQSDRGRRFKVIADGRGRARRAAAPAGGLVGEVRPSTRRNQGAAMKPGYVDSNIAPETVQQLPEVPSRGPLQGTPTTNGTSKVLVPAVTCTRPSSVYPGWNTPGEPA